MAEEATNMSYQTYDPKNKILQQLGAYAFAKTSDGEATPPSILTITNYNLSEADATSRTLSSSANYVVSATTDSDGFTLNRNYMRGSTQEYKKLI